MSTDPNTAEELINRISQKAPEYMNLLTAKTAAEFEEAFDAILAPVIARLEENKKNYADLGEVALTSVLSTGLSIPGLTVSCEKNSNGHVDLMVEADHCVPTRKKLGEAKIWDGYNYQIGGLAQLIERYSTGREGRGLLIAYFQKHKGIAKLFPKFREQMDQELPCAQQGKTADHVHLWSFLSTHAHDSGVNLEVSHVACNLYVEPAPEAKSLPK